VLLRPAGMVSQAEVHIEVDGEKPLKDVEMICLQVEMEIRSQFPDLERISIIPHSSIIKPMATPSPSSFKRWIAVPDRLHQHRQQQQK
jgi:divalent metal cation (Fe/Co/Zn/Cd) transporter